MEIARKIEEAMGGRVGRPGNEIKQHVAEFDKGQSRDIAAEAVGMSGERQVGA